MIETDRQRAVTLDRISRFREAIEHAGRNPSPDVDPVISKAHLDGLKSVLATLECELAAYESIFCDKR